MEELKNDLNKLIEIIGFNDFSINCEEGSNRFLVFINDNVISEGNLPNFISSLDYLAKLMAKRKREEGLVFVDVNNYRLKREELIIQLARGAARKAVATKQEVSLPAMNAYERRIIHVELVSRPDLKTESVGEGKNRFVIIRPIIE